MGGKKKRVSPRGNRPVDGRKVNEYFGCALGIYTRMVKYSFSFGESQQDHLVRNRERVGWFCKQNLQLKQIWNCLKIFPSEERRKRIQNNLAKQEGREGKLKRKGSKVKGKKYGRRPVSE